MMAAEVACPDCGEAVAVPSHARSGDLLDCPHCAGHTLRLACPDGRWSATLADQVSCPSCYQLLTLPAGARVGDTVECCGQRYRLTFDYGAFTAEAAEEPKEGCMSRDRWLALGLVSTVLACVACLTPVLALALGAIGLGAWTGRLDTVLVLLFGGFAALAAYRYWSRRRRPS